MQSEPLWTSNYCPGCGNRVPDDETCWIREGKFYCSERCIRNAAGIK